MNEVQVVVSVGLVDELSALLYLFLIWAQVATLTPNFNRLVAEGATATNVFSYVPLCVPSRSTLLTGIGPEVTQVQ